MTLTVTTQSGSVYRFTDRNGQTIIQKGVMIGIVDPTYSKELRCGERMNIVFREENSEDYMSLNTTPIKDISVSF